jgi:hypothetical protein
MTPATPVKKAKDRFLQWHAQVEKICEKVGKSKKPILFDPENIRLIVHPHEATAALSGKPPIPILSNDEWDSAQHLLRMNHQGTLYRFFYEKTSAGVRTSDIAFLVFKRYQGPLTALPPVTSKTKTRGRGLNAVCEILYSPKVTMPKTGRALMNHYGVHCTMVPHEDSEMKTSSSQSLWVERLIPLGKQGFYMMCSEQQEFPEIVFSGENAKVAVAPNPVQACNRAAHLLKSLCQGKEEDIPKVEKAISRTVHALLETKALRIATQDPNVLWDTVSTKIPKDALRLDNPHAVKNPNTLRAPEFLCEDILGTCKIQLWISENSVNPSGGDDFSLGLSFGEKDKHESDNTHTLRDAWKELTR